MKNTVYTQFFKGSDGRKKEKNKTNKRQATHITSDTIAGIMLSQLSPLVV